ncbi:MAG: hypothetical protein LBI63_02280, partial [Candidatus Ancillula sp.]|nr:hypothetical protein [Candidatus Ancillula sp.]
MTSYIAPPPRCLSSKALGGKKQRKLLLPLVAIATFALVAFSIFAFIKLPAFAEDHAQDLNKTDVSRGDSASSGQDLNKTTVLCGGSASSAKQDAQDLSENRVSRGDSADPAEHEQDNSTQSVPSNEQAQTEQDSVITPPTAQDNCVQTHSAGQDLESNSPITHLNTQNSAQVPLRVQSTTITPKASTGANIALSDDAEATASGAGWTYDSATSVYTINSDATADANLTISGTTTNKRVVVAEGANATVTLSGASIDQSSSDNASGSVFGISSGSSVTLKLQGSNTLKSGCNWSAEIGYAGLNVPSEATLTIESAEEDARLTANGGISAAGIGGNGAGSGPQTVGTITINGGTINAESISATSVGINGGTVNANEGIAGENITISGGTVTSGSISATTSVYITGGTTIVSGGIWSTSVHISGADVTTSEGIEAENITINGGTVNAAGGIVAENITITGGLVYAYTSGGYGDPAAIGGESGTGTISITGGVVIATVGNQNSPGIGRGAGNSEGSISITGGTIISNSKIGLCNGEGKTATTISGHPI